MTDQINVFLQQELTLKQLELITLDLPQKIQFKSGIGVRKSRKALIIKWVDREGNVGFGECSCRPDPYYSAEFMNAALLLTEQFIINDFPEVFSYQSLINKLSKIRGWQFTKAAIEFAAHDLLSKRTQSTIFEAYAQQINKIPVGISIGIQENEASLLRITEESKQAGYHRMKFKISPKSNLKDFEVLHQKFPQEHLTFDANGTFQISDYQTLKTFTTIRNIIEQPTPPGRFDIFLGLKKHLPELKPCWDEDVKSVGDVVKFHQLGFIDEVNIKPGRVGGLVNSLEILDYCQKHHIPCWVGGMFETGIGRSMNLQFAALIPDAKAHDLSPSGRYFKEDVLANPIKMDQNGYVSLADAKTAVVNEAILEKYTIRKKVLLK